MSNDGLGSEGPPGSHGPRRPARTIDLTATELESRPVPGSEPPAEPPEAAASDPPQEERAAGADRLFGAGTARHLGDMMDGSRAPLSRAAAMIGSGVLGGGLVLLGLWAVNGLGPRDSGQRSGAEARLAQLETQLAELRRGQRPAIDPARIDTLNARVAQMESAASQPPRSDPVLAARIAATETRTETLTAAVADVARKSAQPAPAGVDPGEVEAVAKRVAALEAAARTQQADIARQVAQASDRAARFALAAASLRAVVERGEPFTAELAAVKAMSADTPRVAPLDAFAATGLPTNAVLAREFSALAPELERAAGAATTGDGGFLDKLQANAERLVRVRPVNAPPGDDARSIVLRAEARVQSDPAAAATELAQLPASARAPADAWLRKVAARNAALDASRKLAADAATALAKAQP